MKKIKQYMSFALILSALLALPSAGLAAGQLNIFRPQQIKDLMWKVNDYTLDHPYRENDRNWIRATWYSGVMDAYRATGDERYLNQALAWGEKHAYQIGQETSGFNRLFCAMTWVDLYLIEPDPKKIASTVDAMNADLPFAPAVGKVWYGHSPRQNDIHNVYADGLFSSPTFTMLYKATGDRKYLDLLHDAFWKVTEQILDKEEDLFYRGPHFIGKKTRNGGKVLWSRGNGWVYAALPKIIQHLPKNDPYYDRYVDLYRRMSKSLSMRQQDDGFWRANLGDPQHYPMPESSGTAFFVAGFGWGVREGILDRETYLPVIIRGWKALVESVHSDGLFGWVQPVEASPNASHPRTTWEYGVGQFLSAGAQVYLLVKDGTITGDKIQAALPVQSQMLPPAALKDSTLTSREHPLYEQMNAFLDKQEDKTVISTGLKKHDYLEVIAGQVKAMHQYQNEKGRIIDPVEKVEKYFTTPCYAHSVAVLSKAGYPIEKSIIESGMKALDVSLADMVDAKGPGSHGDFFTWPIVLAYELFDGAASPQRMEVWSEQLKQINASKAYRAFRRTPPYDSIVGKEFYLTYAAHFANNWNLVNVAGEWGRIKNGVGGDPWYVDYCMTMHLPSFTALGMYDEKGNPLSYDLFARHYLTGMLYRGYSSFLHTTYRDILWRGGWTSLFMQSPFGELPAGSRSSHHIWNEAEQAVIFEIYASAYARAGRTKEAGAFKRAAMLSLSSIQKWIRPDGSGYIVKNRFPMEAKHGYHGYSIHSCYNMLATSMLAQAWQVSNDEIAELASPADLGGFVVPILTPFHKVFANADGNYIEYDTSGVHKYNPTGLLRIHLKEGHPQLGPSDGCGQLFSGKDHLLAVGPAWRVNGNWQKLADLKDVRPEVTVLEETLQRVRFRVSYPGVSQTVTIDQAGVTVEDEITQGGVDATRVTFPMLVFDGKDKVDVELQGNRVTLGLQGEQVSFTVLEPEGLTLQRSGEAIDHVNGIVEKVYAETDEKRLVYRISAD